MKKGILFISHECGLNGASKSMLNIIDEIQNRYDVHVLIRGTGYLYDELSKKNCKILIEDYTLDTEKLPKDSLKNKIISIIKKIRYYLIRKPKNKKTAKKISEYIKNNNISIIHSNSSSVFMGAYVKELVEVKHIWHFREFLYEDYGLEPVMGWQRMFELVNRNTDFIIYISNSVMEKYKGLLTVKSRRIYNGVPELKQKYNKESHDSFNLLQCGIISPIKGVDVSIKALEILYKKGYQDIELYLAGKGNLSFCGSELRTVIEHVHLLGYVENIMEVRQKNIDAELVCSKSEAFGRVTVEAMQCGIAVIGADTAGTCELINDNENGILFKMGDSEDLAQKIEKLYNDRNTANALGSKGLESSGYFNIKRCVNEIEQVYLTV